MAQRYAIQLHLVVLRSLFLNAYLTFIILASFRGNVHLVRLSDASEHRNNKMKLFLSATAILIVSVAASSKAGNGTSGNTTQPIMPMAACSNPSSCHIVCPILVKTKKQTVAVASCLCGGKRQYSRMCYVPNVLSKSMRECNKCTSDSECSTSCLSPEEGGVCKECASQATLLARTSCFPTCTGDEEEDDEDQCIAPDMTPFSGNCVATDWIENNGHSDGIFKKMGNSRVLCIPDFPCGTAGHMIRVCDRAQACQLKTYAQVCESRGDCTESVMPVSQLRHSYDWSRVSSSSCASSGSLYLTSVSKHPDASEYSLSTIIAFFGDTLNRNGLGLFTDVLITVPDSIRIGIKVAKVRIVEMLRSMKKVPVV